MTIPTEKNHRQGKTPFQKLILSGVLTVGLLLAFVGILFLQRYGKAPEAPVQAQSADIGGPFTLQATDGRMVTDLNFRGQYMVIYFGYTSCPDTCPTAMSNLVSALHKLGDKANKIQPIFITVDPQRDTIAVLKSYVAAFSPRLLGLTGSDEQIQKIEHAYKVYVGIHRTGAGPNDYSVDHSSVFYLIGPDGEFITLLRDDEDTDLFAADLAHYLS